MDEEHLHNGDDQRDDGTQTPHHHAVDPVGVKRVTPDVAHRKRHHAHHDLCYVQGAASACQAGERELELVHFDNNKRGVALQRV